MDNFSTLSADVVPPAAWAKRWYGQFSNQKRRLTCKMVRPGLDSADEPSTACSLPLRRDWIFRHRSIPIRRATCSSISVAPSCSTRRWRWPLNDALRSSAASPDCATNNARRWSALRKRFRFCGRPTSVSALRCCRWTLPHVAAALPDWDCEIVEIHHRRKEDSPSGTALALGQAISEGRKQMLKNHAVYVRHGHVGARTAGEIGFATLRGGDIVGEHTVVFATDGERLEFTHRAGDRDIFAKGALAAA